MEARPRSRVAAALALFTGLALMGAGGWATWQLLLGDGGDTHHLGGTAHGFGVSDETGEGWIPLHFSWPYRGDRWTFDISVPEQSYEWFKAQERPRRYVDGGEHIETRIAYDALVTTPLDDALVQAIADELQRAADAEGMRGDEILSFALAFVQSLQYTSDSVTTGFDEYPRYPLETLVEDGGDCEDSSILYASLVQALGYGVVLVGPPGHMAVGVLADEGAPGAGYTFDGRRYLYAETTGSGWRIGEVPEEYEGQPADVYRLVPRPLFSLEVEYGPVEGSRQRVVMSAKSTGSAEARNVELVGGITSDGQTYRMRDACTFDVVSPGEGLRCIVWLDLQAARGQESWAEMRVQDDEFWYAKARSTRIGG